ncbi:hypothetical protein C0J52_09991 [Blattella germanica]|nr:hypothetical protein C0J52_09991 [Blattella germanica]PSN47989.1 hypothetical protein C0J52_09991 [Blattella germanica]PSN47990.1 hypothetical protein C0J52_09991 [Blattella germanica]
MPIFMSYGLLFWGNHGMASRVFKLQKRAIRTISGDSQRTHCRSLFAKYRILTLYSMYVLSCLVYIKRNITNYDIVSSVHNYQTRNRMNICQDKTKYTITQNSFHYNSIKLYNSVPQAYRDLSKIMFKNKIKNILLSNPLYSVDFYSLF